MRAVGKRGKLRPETRRCRRGEIGRKIVEIAMREEPIRELLMSEDATLDANPSGPRGFDEEPIYCCVGKREYGESISFGEFPPA